MVILQKMKDNHSGNFNVLEFARISMRTIVAFSVAFSMLFVTSCKSSKEVARKPSRHDTEEVKQFVLSRPSFNTMDSKIEFSFSPKEGVSIGMKGNIKMRRDSCMILSLQPFAGIEMAKCLLRQDSIYIISRLHSVYSVISTDDIPYNELAPFSMLTEILTNRIFIPGKNVIRPDDLNKFKMMKEKDGIIMSLNEDSYGMAFRIDQDKHYNRLVVNALSSPVEMDVDYNDFVDGKTGEFPHKIEINASDSKRKIKVDLNFLKPVFDDNIDLNFKISPRYKKVPLKELIMKFNNML